MSFSLHTCLWLTEPGLCHYQGQSLVFRSYREHFLGKDFNGNLTVHPVDRGKSVSKLNNQNYFAKDLYLAATSAPKSMR